jgi:hypothetical protein
MSPGNGVMWAPYAPADCHGDNVAALERWNTVINHRVLSGFSPYTGPHEDTDQTLWGTIRPI